MSTTIRRFVVIKFVKLSDEQQINLLAQLVNKKFVKIGICVSINSPDLNSSPMFSVSLGFLQY